MWLILSKHWLYKRVLWSLRKRQRLRENCSGDPSLLDLNLSVTADHVYSETGDMTSPQTLKQSGWGKTTNSSNIFMILESVWKGNRKQQKSVWNTWEQQTPTGSYRKAWKTSWEQHLKLRGAIRASIRLVNSESWLSRVPSTPHVGKMHSKSNYN